jgi:hypothetical protein
VPFASNTACSNACGNWTVGEYLDGSSYSSTGPAGGNSLECREYHLSAAWLAPGNQNPHCGHIDDEDGGPCTGAVQ